MNAITRTTSQALQLPGQASPLPNPKVELSFRLATMDDLPWMDRLQKMHSKQLGFFRRQQFEGYIAMGGVLIAEEVGGRQRAVGSEAEMHLLPTANRQLSTPLAYCISRDRYLKRDELGVIYQLCVEPAYQRGYIAAAMLREVFNRSAYGCRLYCCWCAQDLAANKFWESMGFVPLAFRAGSDKKKRVHIFWQKRIDGERHEGTEAYRHDGEEGEVYDPQSKINNPKSKIPYWYPFQTNSGAIRSDRIVFPIPANVHWKDVHAVAVPTVALEDPATAGGPWRLDGPARGGAEDSGLRTESKKKALPFPTQSSALSPQSSSSTVPILIGGKIRHVPRPGVRVEVEPVPKQRAQRAKRLPAPKTKIDPKFLTAARELRDRYLEQVDDGLLGVTARYDITRQLPCPRVDDAPQKRRAKRLPGKDTPPLAA